MTEHPGGRVLRSDRRGPGPARLIGAALLAALTAVLVAVLGFSAANAALAGAGMLVVVLLQGLAGEDGEAQWPARQDADRGGYRSEVANLAAALVDRDGRLGERALHELRRAAVSRLRAHGIDPGDRAAVASALGEGAWRTLDPPSGSWPSLRAASRTVAALETLGPGRDGPGSRPAAPAPAPEAPPHAPPEDAP